MYVMKVARTEHCFDLTALESVVGSVGGVGVPPLLVEGELPDDVLLPEEPLVDEPPVDEFPVDGDPEFMLVGGIIGTCGVSVGTLGMSFGLGGWN